MDIFDRMMLDNKAWANEMVDLSPSYFRRLSKIQTPKVLWLGCSDSRVPAEIVVNAEPGEMFVHRNIANQINPTDENALSVIEYALKVLEVDHIVVCGHYGCGGVLAAMSPENPALDNVNHWLKGVRETHASHADELEAYPEDEKRSHRLVELNVLRQIRTLSDLPLIQDAWRSRKTPFLHGCVYGLENGLIRVIQQAEPHAPLHRPSAAHV